MADRPVLRADLYDVGFLNNIDFSDSMAQGSGGGLVVEGFDSATRRRR